MKTRLFMPIIIAGMALFLASASWADVPAPPVNQFIGMPDISYTELVEADCRWCHTDANGSFHETHHLLQGLPIPPESDILYPDANGDGVPDTNYDCGNCHGPDPDGFGYIVHRDCILCHYTPPHHTTQLAQTGDCQICHGPIVNNINDGHYIPVYQPSLVTPWPSVKENSGDPLNSLGTGTGNCTYCHDEDTSSPPLIHRNAWLHHNTGLVEDNSKCYWCHDLFSPDVVNIRTCEGCHGPDSLHNIQVDSSNPHTIGTLVVGGEDAWYGHVGRDAGPGDSDCWGCHGFADITLPDPGDPPAGHDLIYIDENTTEATCRECHDGPDPGAYLPDRHHVLYGTVAPSPTNAPFGTPGGLYVCLSCHQVDSNTGVNIIVTDRDCLFCHQADTVTDSDGDGIPDIFDACPAEDATGFDADGNGCIDDTDGDGVLDNVDNCPDSANTDQLDLDSDGIGDVCDPDADNDGFSVDDCNDLDETINPAQCDIKGDGIDQNCDGSDRTKGKPCSSSGGGTDPPPTTEPEGKGKTCSDEIDNDDDGFTDCDDSDCAKNKSCK